MARFGLSTWERPGGHKPNKKSSKITIPVARGLGLGPAPALRFTLVRRCTAHRLPLPARRGKINERGGNVGARKIDVFANLLEARAPAFSVTCEGAPRRSVVPRKPGVRPESQRNASLAANPFQALAKPLGTFRQTACFGRAGVAVCCGGGRASLLCTAPFSSVPDPNLHVGCAFEGASSCRVAADVARAAVACVGAAGPGRPVEAIARAARVRTTESNRRSPHKRRPNFEFRRACARAVAATDMAAVNCKLGACQPRSEARGHEVQGPKIGRAHV